MAANVPEECPSCGLDGIRSTVKLYQISFEEATVLCENQECMYPLSSGGIIVQSQLNGPNGPLLNENMMPSPKKQDAGMTDCTVGPLIANTYAHSSAALPTSTAFTTTSYNWHSNISTPVYQPTTVAAKPPVPFSWPSPPSSTQTSPALSIISASDKEVELTLKDKDSITFDRLTPSPSPLPKEPFIETTSKSDEIDSFLNEISTGLMAETAPTIDFAQEFPDFFGSEADNTTLSDNVDISSTTSTSNSIERLPIDVVSMSDELERKLIANENVPSSTQVGDKVNSVESITSHSVNSTSTSKTQKALRALGVSLAQRSPSKVIRAIRLTKVPSLPGGIRPIPLPGPVKQNTAPAEATINTDKCPPVQTGIPIKRPTTLVCTSASKRPRLSDPTSELNKNTPAKRGPVATYSGRRSCSTPTPAENPATPRVALEVAPDGTPVFLVQPRAVPATPATPQTTSGRRKAPSSTLRSKGGTRTTTDKPKKTPSTQSNKKKKPTDEAFIESMVSKFVQQANSRKVPPATK